MTGHKVSHRQEQSETWNNQLKINENVESNCDGSQKQQLREWGRERESRHRNWKRNVKIIGNKFSKSVENGSQSMRMREAKRQSERKREVNTHGNLATAGTHSSMSCAGRGWRVSAKGVGKGEGRCACSELATAFIINWIAITQLQSKIIIHGIRQAAVPQQDLCCTPVRSLLLPPSSHAPLSVSLCLPFSFLAFFWRCIALVVARKL